MREPRPRDLLAEQRNQRLRTTLTRLRDTKFGGNQAATARAIGITAASLSDILAGKRGVGIETLLLISDLVHVSLDVLVRGEGTELLHDASCSRVRGAA